MAQTPCSSLLIRYRVLGGRKQEAQPTNIIAPLIESQPPAQSLVDGPGRWLSEGTHKQMGCAASIRQVSSGCKVLPLLLTIPNPSSSPFSPLLSSCCCCNRGPPLSPLVIGHLAVSPVVVFFMHLLFSMQRGIYDGNPLPLTNMATHPSAGWSACSTLCSHHS